MVVATLVNRWFPSSRGILRRSTPQHHSQQQQQDESATTTILPPPNGVFYKPFDDENDVAAATANNNHNNRPKRKRFRAVAALTSFASDLDLISDWIFYAQARRHDREYRAHQQQSFQNNNNDDNNNNIDIKLQKDYLIPPILLTLLLFTCLAGTFMWLVLATDGRIVTPILRRVDIEKLSMGYALLACVLVEDIPQVILTFLIEDYFESADGAISNFALANLTTSLYDTLIKLAEAYDERNDLVETGAWCKASFMAHKDVVTAVMIVPAPLLDSMETTTRVERTRTDNRMESAQSWRTTGSIHHHPTTSFSSSLRRQQQQQSSSVWSLSVRSSSRPAMPRFQFLTASLDKSIRLWDTAIFPESSKTTTRTHDYVCKMKGHTKAVTCMALLGQQQQHRVNLVRCQAPGSLLLDHHPESDGTDHGTFLQKEQEIMNGSTLVVTGCQDGVTKLWNLTRRECIRSFYIPPGETTTSCAVVSVTAIHQGRTFAAGYSNGKIRLWEATLGFCIATFSGHGRGNVCVCSLQDENGLASGSDAECSVRVWDTKEAMDSFRQRTTPQHNEEEDAEGSLFVKAKALSESSIFEEAVCKLTLVGHTAPILCIANVTPGQTVVSGSIDGTARIWAVRPNSVCLRILSGHGGPVRAVAAQDHSSILTSCGAIIRIFDAITGICLREFDGHEGTVTGLSTTHDKRYFLSCASDCTVKTWVVTSISEDDHDTSKDLDELLDLNDKLCV